MSPSQQERKGDSSCCIFVCRAEGDREDCLCISGERDRNHHTETKGETQGDREADRVREREIDKQLQRERETGRDREKPTTTRQYFAALIER